MMTKILKENDFYPFVIEGNAKFDICFKLKENGIFDKYWVDKETGEKVLLTNGGTDVAMLEERVEIIINAIKCILNSEEFGDEGRKLITMYNEICNENNEDKKNKMEENFKEILKQYIHWNLKKNEIMKAYGNCTEEEAYEKLTKDCTAWLEENPMVLHKKF